MVQRSIVTSSGGQISGNDAALVGGTAALCISQPTAARTLKELRLVNAARN